MTSYARGKRKGKGCNKPQECDAEPLKELRLGRCFAYKQHDYQHILTKLEKAFRAKTMTDEGHIILAKAGPLARTTSYVVRGARHVRDHLPLLGCLPRHQRLA